MANPRIEKGMTWQQIAKEYQDHRNASLAAVKPVVPEVKNLPLDSMPVPNAVLTAEELGITESDPVDLAAKLAAGTLKAVTVTKAFLRRAALAQKLVNCVTELLPEAALERAAFLDKYLQENGKPVGPLHGLPISVKEHIGMKGLSLNAGFISWGDRVAPENARILDILFSAGCVFFVRTTEPQTLMHIETSSNFYGVTVNPFNRNLSSGGSSGGEGALVGMRGSCLGIGTDIGGSIRAPAANNGVYGLRPTSYRLPMGGFAATMLGEEQIVPVVGPLSTSLGGVKLFMKTIIDAKPWIETPSLVPIPWNEAPKLRLDAQGQKKLKVAILRDDGIVKPHPPILRALNEVANKLEGIAGVEVVDWTPYKHDQGWEVVSSLYFCDGGVEEAEAIDASGEPWRPLSTWVLKENPAVKKLSVREVWDWTIKRDEYREEYARLWGDVDLIICPVGPGTAPLIETGRYWAYTAQWNLLDYPSLVAPISKVDPALDVIETDYRPRNEKDKYNYELYSPEKYANAPVSLQFVGRRYEDEKVIAAVEYIQEKLGLPWAQYLPAAREHSAHKPIAALL